MLRVPHPIFVIHNLLNEARIKLEKMIDRFCDDYSLSKPRIYRREARKNYLSLAKSKKRRKKKIRKTIRKQLGYIKRNLGYLEKFMPDGYALIAKEIVLLEISRKCWNTFRHMQVMEVPTHTAYTLL